MWQEIGLEEHLSIHTGEKYSNIISAYTGENHSSVYALMLFHSECLVTCGAGKRLFSSVCGQVLFQSEFCYMCCRQKDVYSVYAVMLFQCELLVTFGAVKRFFFSVYGAVLFHFKFLNTCRMFFTSVYDLMLTTAYCG